MLAHGLRGNGINKGIVGDIAAKQMGRKVGAIGDSITSQCWSTSATQNYTNSNGYLSWLRVLSKQSVDVSYETTWATSGYTTTQIVNAGYHTSAAAAGLDFCIVHCGINDDSSLSTAFATATANLTSIYNAILASGAVVVAIPIMSQASISTSKKKFVGRVNNWIYTQAKNNPRIIVVDPNPYVISHSTGEPITNYTSDGLHPSIRGAYWIGKLLWDALSNFIPARDVLHSWYYDDYDAADYPSGNLISAGMMTGTGGWKGTNGTITGNVADTWNLNGGAAMASISVAASKVARTDGIDGVWQQLALSGTSPATVQAIQFYLQAASFGTEVSVGDTIEAMMEFEVDAGHSNILNICSVLSFTGASYSSVDMAYNSSTITILDTGSAIKGVLRTRPIVVPSGASNFTFNNLVYMPASSTVSATWRFGRAVVRKITT